MARGAGPRHRVRAKRVRRKQIEPVNAAYRKLPGVEEFLSPRDRAARRVRAVSTCQVLPRAVECERGFVETLAQGIVDPDKEALVRQKYRTAVRSVFIDVTGGAVVDLSVVNLRLEAYDLCELVAGGRIQGLRVAERRVGCLALEARLPSVPHDRQRRAGRIALRTIGQEAQIG